MRCQINAFPNSNLGSILNFSRIFDECRICDLPLIGHVEIHTEDPQYFRQQTLLTCIQ